MNHKILLLSLLIGLAFCLTTEYTREFQISLDRQIFRNQGREHGMQRYIDSFEQDSGLDFSTLHSIVYIRKESIRGLDECGSDAILITKESIYGINSGLTEIDLKSGGARTQREAEQEPFEVATEYSNKTIRYIEYDIHPCAADFAATSRVVNQMNVDLTSCDDVRNYFPNFANEDGNLPVEDNFHYSYVVKSNSSAWGGDILLAFVLSYPSLEDAKADTNFQNGEFSYTITAPNSSEYTTEQTQEAINTYKHLLNDVGDSDYPCDPEVDVADFFSPNYDGNISSAELLFVNCLLFFCLTTGLL